LANISLWGPDELERVGWLNNPVIDILYSMTSAGVWIARTDSTGKVEEKNSNVAKNYAGYVRNFARQSARASVGGNFLVDAEAENSQPRLDVINFTSNAGGTLDADVDLQVALAGYYGVVELRFIRCNSGETPTFVVQDDDGAVATITTETLTANVNSISTQGLHLYSGTDNKGLFIDTTSSNLGNAKEYWIEIYKWYET